MSRQRANTRFSSGNESERSLKRISKHGLFTCGHLLVIMAIALCVLLTTACEPIAPITIQNKTDERLTVFINGDRIGDVMPSAEIKNKSVALIYVNYLVEAKNMQGKIVFSRKITYEQFEGRDPEWKSGWTVVIQVESAPSQ